MKAILGIDAAWTSKQPSGVALIEGEGDRWKILTVAPSYQMFIRSGQGVAVDWQVQSIPGSPPDFESMLSAAQEFTSSEISVVAVDMPMSTKFFDSRREADRQISKKFGVNGCSTHSPTAQRPGEIGRQLVQQLDANGYPLATADSHSWSVPSTIEVYPHTGLLRLLSIEYRLPYKVSRSLRYWPGVGVQERIVNLLGQYRLVYNALQDVFGVIPFQLPRNDEVNTLASLKRYEDAIDALICAWIGREFLAQQATPHGDDSSAIWVP